MSRVLRFASIIVLAVAPATLSGCLLAADCYKDRTSTYRVAEPPPMELEVLVRDCEADPTKCTPLCAEVLHRNRSFAYEGVEACTVTHDGTGHDVTVDYVEHITSNECGQS